MEISYDIHKNTVVLIINWFSVRVIIRSDMSFKIRKAAAAAVTDITFVTLCNALPFLCSQHDGGESHCAMRIDSFILL